MSNVYFYFYFIDWNIAATDPVFIDDTHACCCYIKENRMVWTRMESRKENRENGTVKTRVLNKDHDRDQDGKTL